MAIRQMLRRSLSSEKRSSEVPKGHFAVYVGENEKKRFVIPVSYLNHSSFQELLCQAEEEYGFDHPMGGLTIPCSEDLFVDLTSRLSRT
ncbi:indole-3-acetic acid-induced protein arg7 [Phtheirospermum japonicum]|uniref:Indole-3-acetic acid-induced protein arg7 n=1 Tax=Phtheirospermum japonicum TaxID=374723 RepID=A0A830D9J2_9LAMI|nr:indole-3-acetic acid-induced protein arg7 [Phtheirospermum japonicum]